MVNVAYDVLAAGVSAGALTWTTDQPLSRWSTPARGLPVLALEAVSREIAICLPVQFAPSVAVWRRRRFFAIYDT